MVFDRHFFHMKWKIRWKKTVYSSLAILPIELYITPDIDDVVPRVRLQTPKKGQMKTFWRQGSGHPPSWTIPNCMSRTQHQTPETACTKEMNCRDKRIVCWFYNQTFLNTLQLNALLLSLPSSFILTMVTMRCLMCEQNNGLCMLVAARRRPWQKKVGK